MKNYFDLTGQVAIVTGCSTGLGVQMAKALANQGATIVALARRKEKIEEVAKTVPPLVVSDVEPVARKQAEIQCRNIHFLLHLGFFRANLIRHCYVRRLWYVQSLCRIR